MHGNVWEWCWDGYEKYDAKSPAVDPTAPTGVSDRVVRGGGWINSRGNAGASYRNGFPPDFRNFHLGFRVARSESRGQR